MTGAIYVLFFCSGFSALIYQVVWVRVFGTVFGSTVYSASVVLAVFMVGLGAGSYLVGAWADRRHARAPGTLLADYGALELAIGLSGLGISAILPHLGRLSALVSSYATDANGWHVLSTGSYLSRLVICALLLAPITILMGGTLTLLIRHLVQSDLMVGTRRIASLYGVNTLGAGVGALLTDYAIVPFAGLWAAQGLAVLLNLGTAVAALVLGARLRRRRGLDVDEAPPVEARSGAGEPRVPAAGAVFVALALASSGFAAMGMEIVWFRHVTLLLGSLRAVFSMLLTVILFGIGVGSLLGGVFYRRTGRAAEGMMVAQALFVVLTLWGMTVPDTRSLAESAVAVGQRIDVQSAAARRWAEMWFNLEPIVLETFVPALLMGLMFPLGNALVQRADAAVGRRAGLLYLSNTLGAVGGVLVAGFVLVPRFGIQTSAAVLTAVAWSSIVPVFVATRAARAAQVGWGLSSADVATGSRPQAHPVVLAVSMLAGALALGTWLRLPPDYVLSRALLRPTGDERLIAMNEGVNEVVAVTEYDGDRRRWLLTNGYPMSSTGPVEQRYMRALAHVPLLLSVDPPETVLVIGFGVGNTADAAAIHPTMRRVDLADLSKDILSYGRYFTDANHDVLRNGRVRVFVNDGRQHLQMQPEGTYDLITLEPPPIAHAGVGALYSTEFYRLARTRLKPGGFVSQWLPAYQVPAATTLSIVRAFLDIFPQAVLLSGGQPNLLLVGANEGSIEIDPERVAAALAAAPAVRADLERVNLGSVREIVGTFVGSAATLEAAARQAVPVSDDRPLQEYSVGSLINFGLAGVPAAMVDLTRVGEWCPRCSTGGATAPAAAGLDAYLAVLGRAYMVPSSSAADFSDPATRQMIDGSEYLRLLLRNAAAVRNDRGLRLASAGRLDEAIEEFEEALRLRPGFAVAEDNLSATLARRRQAQ